MVIRVVVVDFAFFPPPEVYVIVFPPGIVLLVVVRIPDLVMRLVTLNLNFFGFFIL